MVSRGTRRALTAEGFGKFLRWLSEDDQRAVAEYQLIRMKLVRYFMHKGCADPEELFDKTVDIVVGKVGSFVECPSPLAFCFGVAKNIARQDLRERKSARLGENIVSPIQADPEIHEQELICLDRCMDQLSPSDRDIVIRYHQGQGRDKIETRRLMADGMGGMNTLRIRMWRIRKDLRACVADCMRQSAN